MEERVRNCTEKDELAIAMYYRKNIVPLMEEIRKDADKAEMITARKYWPFPTYRELLFGVD
jgi:glutamine synthetase